MIDLDNQTDLQIDIDILEKILHVLSSSSVELLIVDNNTMRAINNTYRGADCDTDVLSFPLDTTFTPESIMGFPLGSIVISKDYLQKSSQRLGHSIQDELALLFIHGVLHLLGFDHESDNGEMRKKEEDLVVLFELPKSITTRAGG